MRRLVLVGVLGLAAAVLPQTRAQAATFTVNSTADLPDTNTLDGVCRSSANTCTLRAAIQQANAQVGADTITVPAGTYTLTSTLPLSSSMTIAGAGAASTILKATNLLMLANITAGVVNLQDLAFAGSTSASGALAVSQAGGTSTLTRVRISDNTSTTSNSPTAPLSVSGGEMTITQSSITGNRQTATGSSNILGSGLYVGAAQVTLADSTIADNVATAGGNAYGGGVVVLVSGALDIVRSTIADNEASYGGNVYSSGTISFKDSIVTDGTSNVPAYTNCDLWSPGTFLGRNIISDATCGAANGNRTIAAPSLGALVRNPLGTDSMSPTPDSPAVDLVSCANAVDQRGVARPVGSGCDVGAVELSADSAVTASSTVQTAPVGNSVALTAQVTNKGPDPLIGATLTTSVQNGSFVTAPGCTVAAQVSCPISPLPPDGSVNFVIVVSGTSAGMLTATATVSSASPDPVGSDNTAYASYNVTSADPGGGTGGTGPPPACSVVRKGTAKADRLTGTSAGDRLLGLGGNDRLKGLAGDDCLTGGKGKDRLVAGPGNDKVFARDGHRDIVKCGPGKDTVIGDKRDKVAKDCEVRRLAG